MKKHLLDEIDYWKPKIIVVCGKPARETFSELKSMGLINFEYETVPHPTAWGKHKDKRIERFIEIGKKLNHLK